MSEVAGVKIKDSYYDNLDKQKIKQYPKVKEISSSYEEYDSRQGCTPSKFITIDGQSYFVKYPTVGSDDSNNYRAREFFIELFISFLSKKVGIDCIDTEILIDNQTQALGIISKNFGEHITYRDFGGSILDTPVDEIIDRIKLRTDKLQNVDIDYDLLTEQLNRMSCFDYLTVQWDRSGANFAFLIEDKNGKKSLKLAPLYDNANAFLEKCGRFFKINPDDCKVYGIGQQELLNGKYNDMLKKFEQMFSEQNYPKLLEEFYAEYGVNHVLNESELLTITTKIQSQVKRQIEYCHSRENKDIFIPLEVVFAVIKRHKAEHNFDFNSWNLDQYYGREEGQHSYENFYNKTVGEFKKWNYYDECLELAKNPNKQEILLAKQELDARRRKLYYEVLKLSLDGKFVHNYGSYGNLGYLLNGDDSILQDVEKRDKEYKKEFKVYFIGNNYEGFKFLRQYIEENRDKRLGKEEQIEYLKIKKLLNKYIKYVNSCTNEVLSNTDRKILDKIDMEDFKKL